MKTATNCSMLSALVGTLTLAGSTAHAQWTVTNLHPFGALASSAHGGSGTQQVGHAYFGTQNRAGLWNGTAISWDDIGPIGATESFGLDMAGTQQSGYAIIGGEEHAGLWNGTLLSFVDLHPAGSTRSRAWGTSGTHQAGYATFNGTQRASLWSGTAASRVDLHPVGARWSGAYGISGPQQVGGASIEGVGRACLWNGTAASLVDLHLAGRRASIAYGTSGTQQVGWTAAISGNAHAGLWSGTAASWVDLHPATPSLWSVAYGTSGTQQVGFVEIEIGFGGPPNYMSHASLWSGTAASWEDLSLALTGSWGATVARDVWSDGTTLYVVGYGVNLVTGRREALLWSRPLEPCYADCDGSGTLDIFDFLCFQNAFVAGCPWHRASDWVPGGAHGTTINNPGPDPLGRPVWSYEWTTGGPLGSASPWYAQATQRSTWDEDWFGIGQGAWSQDDDVNPPIFRNRMTHNITAASWSDIPIVRWLNPAGNGTEVALAGSLTVRWSGEGGVGSPVDVDVVIAMSDASLGAWEVLFAATVSKPIPQPTIGDEVILPIRLEGVVLDESDSIVISHRAVSDSGSTGRWIVLVDDVAITGPAFGCYADCDGSGRLDIFDFLCFQNSFVAGCP